MSILRSSRLVRNRILYSRFAVAALLFPLAVSAPSWPPGSAAHEGIEWVGYIAAILCVLGRVWCTAYVGGRKKREIVDRGPYSLVRNPLYVFSFIGLVGVGLLTGSVTWAVLLGAGFALYYGPLVRREEAFLLETFPVEYRRYFDRTPRWIPNPALWRDEAAVTLDTRLLLRSMADGVWFLLAFPALEGLESLQSSGVLPVLLRLP